MYELLALAIVLLFFALKYRETFVFKYGNPLDGEDIVSFEPDAKGKRVFGWTPDTCPSDRYYQDGLCYLHCDSGYHGVADRCWADTFGVGMGTIPALKTRKQTTTSWGSVGCTGGRRFRVQGYSDCYNITIDVPYQECPAGREMKDGLCYKTCPPNFPNRVPGMPYLCYLGTKGLSYGRGGGWIPPLYVFGQ
jgi:hypothetical protein